MDQNAAVGKRVAFFGGSFDPPHLGHLAVARAAKAALNLDTILFAPVGAQPLKPHGSTAPYEDRLAMTKLATAGEAGFAISLADAPQPGGAPNYTLETLRKLREVLPAGSELFCLMGADSFVGLRKWRGGTEIPFAASLIVASRPGQRLDHLAAQLPQGLNLECEVVARESDTAIQTQPEAEIRLYRLRNQGGKIAPFYLLPGLQVEISASAIRQQVRSTAADRVPTLDVLPLAVADYIRSHGLYQ
jgi:nicotinate-nucleotide adenylyltransferase